MGSNPIEDADMARYAIWQSGEAQTFVVCGFDSHPCHSITRIARTTPDYSRNVIANENASAGHWRAQVAVTHPPRALQVQLLPDALDDRPVLLAVQDTGPSSR